MIDRATIDKIMDATNIVDVVGEFVTLRKAGVNYKGLCPFHDDKTPSFMVSPSKQICKFLPLWAVPVTLLNWSVNMVSAL